MDRHADIPSDLAEQLEMLEVLYIQQATGTQVDASLFSRLRSCVANNPALAGVLPSWIRLHRTPDGFWHFIQPKFRHYQQRREFIAHEFQVLYKAAEADHASPAAGVVGNALNKVDSEHVRNAWNRALQRRTTDPEGAVTAARSLVESVCRHILHSMTGADPASDCTLAQLYKQVAGSLSLAPDQHSVDAFKRILGGCATVVDGIGSLRNRIGDAHGVGPRAIRPAARHAALAVNLAGSMSMFLIETWECRSGLREEN